SRNAIAAPRLRRVYAFRFWFIGATRRKTTNLSLVPLVHRRRGRIARSRLVLLSAPETRLCDTGAKDRGVGRGSKMSARFARVAYLAFCSVGCCLILAAACFYFADTPVQAVYVPETEIEIPDAWAEHAREVILRVENRSYRPIRVLGLAEC